MNHPAWQVRIVAAAFAFGATALFTARENAQAPLPATAPTTITPSQLPSANPIVPHGHTDITWDGHLLRITADGESLAEVLSTVAARTGTHLSGSTPSDPIYGTYGPAPIVDVLSDLLNGLPLNMLFVNRIGNKPAELILTARSGGVTPPSSDAQQQQFAQTPPQPQQQAPYTPIRQPYQQPAQNVAGPPPTVPPPPGNTTDGNGQAPGSNAPADTGNPTSPNGVKTPQEIFEQLQRLRNGANASQTNPQ